MLTAAELRATQQPRRPQYSDKQRYEEYILQRIEGYKNSIGRAELLRLGDEAVAELHSTSESQFLLTEVLVMDSVDRLLRKRLRLGSYRKWRQHFLKLREAQRTPTHWGLEAEGPVARLVPRIEADDATLVIGGGAEPWAYLLAAHDAAVTFVAADKGVVDRVESRMFTEALGSLFEGYVAPLEPGLPDILCFITELHLVVIDPGAIAELKTSMRPHAVRDLQRRTRSGGTHVLLPTCKSLAPESLLKLYDGWVLEEDPKRRRRSSMGRVREGIVLSSPTCPADTS
jgi:hypothetical protein